MNIQTRIGLACVAAGALTAVGVGYAATDAHADPNGDYVFLHILHQNNIYNSDGDQTMIVAGHQICVDFNHGASFTWEVAKVMRLSSLDAKATGYFIGAATASYCPQYRDYDGQGDPI